MDESNFPQCAIKTGGRPARSPSQHAVMTQ